MRRSINIILTVVVICSLVLTFQHSMLAQVKSEQESPRAIVGSPTARNGVKTELQRLQQEMEDLKDKIAENPSSSKVGKMKSKIQWNMRKIKEITPRIGGHTERKTNAKGDIKKTQISGVERYRAIIQNNLFMPLGSGGEVKREEFVLIGTMGRSAFIQMKDSDKSFYVAEGQSFGNNAKLVRVGENSVTIVHEGSKKELELARVTFIGESGGTKGGRTGQRQEKSGKSGKEMKTAYRAQKQRWDGGEKKGGDTDWARKMSMDELSKVRGDIERHIEGLRMKGVRDPEEYKGALKKMETVERAMAERESSK